MIDRLIFNGPHDEPGNLEAVNARRGGFYTWTWPISLKKGCTKERRIENPISQLEGWGFVFFVGVLTASVKRVG